jgi:hypothetical protein
MDLPLKSWSMLAVEMWDGMTTRNGRRLTDRSGPRGQHMLAARLSIMPTGGGFRIRSRQAVKIAKKNVFASGKISALSVEQVRPPLKIG